MKNFKRSGSEGNSRGGFDRREEYGSRDDSRPAFQKKYDATCSDCGRVCQVPFRPNGKKPVFCTDCFSAKRGAPASHGEQREFTPRAPQREFHEQRPTAPVTPVRDARIDELKTQMQMVISKLDRIMQTLETAAKPAVAKEVVKEMTKEITLKAKPVVKPTAKPVAKVVAKPAVKVVAKKVAPKAKPVAKKKK